MQLELFNGTILAALWHCVTDHPKDLELYTDTLCYAYNTQIPWTTKLVPSELVLSRRPLALRLTLDDNSKSDALTATKHTLK